MKRTFPILTFLLMAGLTYANDSYVDAAGGNARMMDGSRSDVSMTSQIIRITLEADYYSADVSFMFFNPGPTVRHRVGFPEYTYGTSESATIRNFACWVNESPSKFTLLPDAELHNNRTTRWFVRDVEFPGGKTTSTRVRYDANYAQQGSFRAVEYLYGTAGSWAGPVDSIVVEIRNHGKVWPMDVAFKTGAWNMATREMEYVTDVPFHLETTQDDLVTVFAGNVAPYRNDVFEITIGGPNVYYKKTLELGSYKRDYFSYEDDWDSKDPGILRFANQEIGDTELKLLSNDQLQILRNTIYAIRGYSFKDQKWRAYFGQQYWYRESGSFREESFTPMEKRNIEKIIREEKSRVFMN